MFATQCLSLFTGASTLHLIAPPWRSPKVSKEDITMRSIERHLTILALLLATSIGCIMGSNPASGPKVTADDFKQLGLAFHNSLDSARNGPQEFADLARFLPKQFESSKMQQIEFCYGVGLREMTAGSSKTVVAFEKNVTTTGGLVLFGDGNVKSMSAAEFENAPKAWVVWTAGPDGRLYSDKSGQFQCQIPAGWTVCGYGSHVLADQGKESETWAYVSKLKTYSGNDEIRVTARPTTRHTLDESDKSEMKSVVENILNSVRKQGGSGELQDVKFVKVRGEDALENTLEISRPNYRWVRQVKFKKNGLDHTLGLYVSTQAKQETLVNAFQKFLDNYESTPTEKSGAESPTSATKSVR
jgi:hypothetical protein